LFLQHWLWAPTASILSLLVTKIWGSLITSEKELLALPHMAIGQTDLVVAGFVFGQFLGF